MNEQCETLTPPQLARRWGVHPDKVHQLIRAGDLIAMNLATKRNGKHPRYRIKLTEVERFEQSRSTKPAAPPTRRRRRRKLAPTGQEWF